jgi:triphosphatase
MHARWLTKAPIDKPNRQRLTSIYFDTPDFALRDQGVSLRVRKTDSANLQTIKATGGDIVRRDEWENEIEDDRPKLSLARNTALAPLLNNQIKRELRPAFETDVERVVVPLRIGKSDIEIAFDQGRVNTPDDHDSVSEIEIELKQGRRSDMACSRDGRRAPFRSATPRAPRPSVATPCWKARSMPRCRLCRCLASHPA